jgi:two-component system, OmpR family, response regulator RegX3
LSWGQSDVVLLDLELPDLDGVQVCRKLRERTDAAIIVVTAHGEEPDRVMALDAGADDYLVKPFALRELLLRVGALLRRSRAAAAPTREIVRGDFRLDPARRRVHVRGDEVPLAAREYELLAHLVQHDGEVLSRDDILREVWGWSFGEASTVTVHVRRLREKIEQDPRRPLHLLTEWGAGYRFSADGSGS